MAKPTKDIKQEYGTHQDIERALESLSLVEEIRLEKFAKYRILGLGRMAMGRSHEDLLSEAITSTLVGVANEGKGRRWRKGSVSFVQHLFGAIRSISSHWKEAFEDDEAYLDSELAKENEEGETISPLANVASPYPDPERVLIAKETLAALYKKFHDDDEAALVIEGIKEGWTGPQIMEQFQMSQKRFDAALKRIRYHQR